MHIKKIEIDNFRILKNIKLLLEEDTTVIVGRNNSGKTALTELFRRLLGEQTPVFQLVDFSLQKHFLFWEAFKIKNQNCEDSEIRSLLPAIEVKITISYEKDSLDLGPLGDFIVDLEPDSTEALIVIRYQLKDGEVESFFKDISYEEGADEDKQKNILLKNIRDRIPTCYSHVIYAVDPNDQTNQKKMDWSQFRSLLHSNFIFAQRGLDDTTHKEINQLGNILEKLLDVARADMADANDQTIVKKLEEAVEKLQENIDGDFKDGLQKLLPSFSVLGYPGMADPKLITETNLNIKNLMNKNHTKVLYTGIDGINLPETYNGLGVRNLIFIMLKLYEFAKSIKVEHKTPGICIIFIEEPEVHLHPQMQQVFIRNLNEFFKKFFAEDSLPAQFVITTHSSHIANEAPFKTMRYFLAKPENSMRNTFYTKIKDLQEKPLTDKDFLHKYMTLTRCDLLFADKAVLIEGATERLMLPEMIKKVDGQHINAGNKLATQYISIVEVGGAYAYLFFDLIEFLELRTLIITDLDSVKLNENGRYGKCMFSEGTHISNISIKKWFNSVNISSSELVQKPDDEKIKNLTRIAYEIPESDDSPCGRSFEDAFMLANQTVFEINSELNSEKESKAWKLSKNINKTDFAVEYGVNKPEWVVPRYIAEGLRWLSEGGRCQINNTEVQAEDNE